MNTEYRTSRLILKVLTCNAGKSVADFYNKNFEEFNRYEPLSLYARTVSYHKNNLKYEHDMFLKGLFIRFFIFEKENPLEIIGTVSYRDIRLEYYRSCTIGYKMDKSKRRRGYCLEAVNMGNSLIFSKMGLNRIEATVLPSNTPSIALLEKAGFTREGLLREKIMLNDIYQDHFLYSLLRKDTFTPL